MHDEHVPHPCMHAPQRLRVELEQRISTHEETLEEAVRYAARRMNAGTMGQLSGSGGATRTTNDIYPSYRVHASTQWQGLLTRLLPAYCQVSGIRRDCA